MAAAGAVLAAAATAVAAGRLRTPRLSAAGTDALSPAAGPYSDQQIDRITATIHDTGTP
jgi:hypothetical protein